MRKNIFLLFVLTFLFSYGQQNSFSPWLVSKSIAEQKEMTFNELQDNFNSYWLTHNKDTKGSGYKPHKRWEYYWRDFVQQDGNLAASSKLWQDWENMNALKSSFSDLSDWMPAGPYSFVNSGSWSAGQGRVNEIHVDPTDSDIIYIGAPAGGIWKSEDAGASWMPLTDDLPQIGVSGIAVDPNNNQIIYIVTGDDDGGDSYSVGVFKSLDGGATWNTTGLTNANGGDSMSDIFMSPLDSNMLWVATENGAFKTIDGGVNWTNSLTQPVTDLKLKPGDPSVIYAATNNRVYKSTDFGDTFSPMINVGLPLFASGRYVMAVTEANPEYLYVLIANGQTNLGLYKSTNSGASFSLQNDNTDVLESNQAWYDLALTASDTNPDEIYTGCLNIWKSTNGGQNFTKVNNWNDPDSPSYSHADIHFLRFFNGELFCGSDGGIYKSSNGGDNFSSLTDGLMISQFYKITVSNQSSQKMVGGLQDNGGYAYKDLTWRNYYGADGMDTAIDPNNSDLIYGFIQQGGSMYISSNGGESITGSVSSPGGVQGNWVTPLVSNSVGDIYAGYTSLYKLVNGNFVSDSQDFGSEIDNVFIDPTDDAIYLTIGSSLYYRSADTVATNFTQINTLPSFISSIAISSSDNNTLWFTTTGVQNRVYKSTDKGVSYTDITLNLPDEPKLIVVHQPKNENNPVYLGTSLGVYTINDLDTEWQPFMVNLPNVSIRDLEINTLDGNITAATYGRGIWQSSIPVILPSNDIHVLEVVASNSGVSCDIQTPIVTIKNTGLQEITSIDFEYSVAGIVNTFTWTGNLLSENTLDIALPALPEIASIVSINVNATISNDAYADNNAASGFVYTNFSEEENTLHTFDSAEDTLLSFDNGSGNSLWEKGSPSGELLNSSFSGSQVYATNLDGNHPDNTVSHLYTPCYDFTNIDNPVFEFQMAFDLELNWDIMYIEYTTDNGVTWNVLGSADDANWYNSDRTSAISGDADCFNCPGAQWTGTESDWAAYSYDMTALSSESSISFRFTFVSDQAVNQEGVVIDDFVITGSTLSIEEFETSGISIYPNPSKDVFNFTWEATDILTVEIYDILGKKVSYKVLKSSTNESSIDVSNYSAGVYIAKIVQEGKTYTKKLLVK